MTMFTVGRLQAYERMMQQTPTYRDRDWKKPDKQKKRTGSKKPVPKGGDRDGRHQG